MEQEKQDMGYRRARVNRLKRIIVGFVLTAWIVPILVSVYVLVCMSRQQDSIARLEQAVLELSVRLAEDTANVSRQETVSLPKAEEAEIPVIEENQAELEQYAGEKQLEASTLVAEEEPEAVTATKRIYLTFDDGPSVFTQDICDILAKYDIKATFFVNGKTGDWADEAMKRIVEDGHTLGMHSYSHQYESIYSSVEDFAADFEKIHEHIYQVTGYDSRVYRFPGGSSNAKSPLNMQIFMKYLETKDTVFFDWNISSEDATKEKKTVQQIVANCTKNLDKFEDCVILCHDAQSKQTTVEALPLVIEKIMEMEGVEFLPLTTDSVRIQHLSLQAEE